MKIASPTKLIAQSAWPNIGPITKLRAPSVVAANMAALAEKTLGLMLKDKKSELLTGPSKPVIINHRPVRQNRKGPSALK